MIGIQTRHYQSGTVLSSQESEICSHYGPLSGRCEDKPSPTSVFEPGIEKRETHVSPS